MKSADLFRTLSFVSLAVLYPRLQHAGELRSLTLTEAVHLAISQNHALKIARLKVIESEQRKAGERSAYFPSITNQSNALHITELENIEVPSGALGTVLGTPIPLRGFIVPQGRTTLYSSGTMLSQPLTQLIRIREANRIAAAEIAVSREDLKKAENETALQTHTLYFGILITLLQKQAAEQQTTYAAGHLRESEENVRNGSALDVETVQGRAGLLESQQAVLTAELQLSDLTVQLNDLLGLPLDTRLDLAPVPSPALDHRSREEYVRAAWSENPEIAAAEQFVRKARAAVTAAKSAYVPDITAYARYSYQVGVPFLVRNFGTFGFKLDWDVFDFGKRRAAVRERETQLAEAEENLRRLKDQVAVAIELSYHKVEQTRNMVQVATQVVALRRESERLARNQLAEDVVLLSERQQATAATYKAQADFLQASLGYLLARAELERTAGRAPGS